jgi:hypothetical protein
LRLSYDAQNTGWSDQDSNQPDDRATFLYTNDVRYNPNEPDKGLLCNYFFLRVCLFSSSLLSADLRLRLPYIHRIVCCTIDHTWREEYSNAKIHSFTGRHIAYAVVQVYILCLYCFLLTFFSYTCSMFRSLDRRRRTIRLARVL